MLSFREISLETDRDFIVDLFVDRAFESGSDAERRQGLKAYKQDWLEKPTTVALLHRFDMSLADPATIAQIVQVRGTDAGFIWVTFDQDPGEPLHAELRLIAFPLRFQRQGLGRLTMQHIEDVLAERGIEVLRSSGSAPSEGVRRFHDTMGFEAVQTVYEKRVRSAVQAAPL